MGRRCHWRVLTADAKQRSLCRRVCVRVAELFRRHQMPCLPGEFRRRQIIESLVRATLIVLNSPSFDLRPGLVNRLEPVNVQAFVPERSVERLDEAVVGRLAGPVEVDRPGGRTRPNPN